VVDDVCSAGVAPGVAEPLVAEVAAHHRGRVVDATVLAVVLGQLRGRVGRVSRVRNISRISRVNRISRDSRAGRVSRASRIVNPTVLAVVLGRVKREKMRWVLISARERLFVSVGLVGEEL
jgi:hypothetical protein